LQYYIAILSIGKYLLLTTKRKMPTFLPKKTNFYTRANNRTNVVGVSLAIANTVATGLPTAGGITGGNNIYSPINFPNNTTNTNVPRATNPYVPGTNTTGPTNTNATKAAEFAAQTPRAITAATQAAYVSPTSKASTFAQQEPRKLLPASPPAPGVGLSRNPNATTGQSPTYIPKDGVLSPSITTDAPVLEGLKLDSPGNSTTDSRVIISDQTGLFINQSPVFDFLKTTGGVLFPYPPTITVGHRANYEMENLLHSNYTTPYYTHSSVDSIGIQARFTAQTEADANYILAMMHFFRTVTKMFYAGATNRGTPPPVLFLDAYGQYMFDHIPIVVKEFQYTLPNDVNYMTINFQNASCKVPLDLTVSLDTMPVYSRNKISNQFDLKKFSTGGLLTTPSKSPREGGWI
jgi:hypothetical protein